MPKIQPMGAFLLAGFAAYALLGRAHTVCAGPYDSIAAQSFVDHIGINIHADGYATAYDNFDRNHLNPQPDPVGLQNIEAALKYLHIAHVRDGIDNQYFVPLYTKMNADLGIKFDFDITAARFGGDSTGDVGFAFKIKETLANPAIVDEVEGANESDVPSWSQLYNSVSGLPATLLVQEKTLAAVNAVPSLYGRTIQASFANEWDVQDIVPDPYNKVSNVLLATIPSIVQYANFGNAHIYFSTGQLSRQPGTSFPPYHTDDPTLKPYYAAFNVPFGQINLLTYNASLLAPGKPVIATETGYHTTPNNLDGIDQTTQAKYTMSLLFDAFNAGLARAYLFELVDEKPDPTGKDATLHYGLYNSDWSPKPAATALHNLITLMSDAGAPLGGTLNYVLSGTTPTLGSRLFRRSDGTYVLALWSDVRVCGPNSVPISPAPAPVSVTVQLPKQATAVKVYDPLVSVQPVLVFPATAHFTVSVPDHPTLVFISGL